MDWITPALAVAIPAAMLIGYAVGHWLGRHDGRHEGKFDAELRWKPRVDALEKENRELRIRRPHAPWVTAPQPALPRSAVRTRTAWLPAEPGQLIHRRNEVDGEFETVPGRPSPVPSAASIAAVNVPIPPAKTLADMSDGEFRAFLGLTS